MCVPGLLGLSWESARALLDAGRWPLSVRLAWACRLTSLTRTYVRLGWCAWIVLGSPWLFLMSPLSSTGS
jgi:hypothetical protein